MNESQATIEGRRHPLTQPFMVIATENPIEFHGTYPLPEAQLDRFLIRLAIGYPSIEVEAEILKSHARAEPLESIEPVLSLEQVRDIQQQVAAIHTDESIVQYIVEIAHATRNDSRIQLGVSTRGTLMLARAARGRAYLQNRDFVTPDDVLWVWPYVLPHRILLTAKTRHSGMTAEQVLTDIVGHIKVPV
jgi:MoxR-like ATPase